MPPGAHGACRLCLACAIGVSQGATQEFALEPRSCPLPWWYLMLSVVLNSILWQAFLFFYQVLAWLLPKEMGSGRPSWRKRCYCDMECLK